jgi:general secretion pathway protein J
MPWPTIPLLSSESAPADGTPRPRFLGTRGFTLVELLVALTLMALISIMLFGGMRFGMRAWETAGERAEGAAQIELVQNLLRRQLGQARLTPTDAGRPIAAFAGQPDRVTFIASPVRPGEGDDNVVFTLAKADANRRSHLDLGWSPGRPPADAPVAAGAARLIDNVATVELAYYGALDRSSAPGWWDEWDSAHGLPSLVRLRVTFPEGDSRRWPDLIIRLIQASN